MFLKSWISICRYCFMQYYHFFFNVCKRYTRMKLRQKREPKKCLIIFLLASKSHDGKMMYVLKDITVSS